MRIRAILALIALLIGSISPVMASGECVCDEKPLPIDMATTGSGNVVEGGLGASV